LGQFEQVVVYNAADGRRSRRRQHETGNQGGGGGEKQGAERHRGTSTENAGCSDDTLRPRPACPPIVLSYVKLGSGAVLPPKSRRHSTIASGSFPARSPD